MSLGSIELSKLVVAVGGTALVTSTFWQWAPRRTAGDAPKDSLWRPWSPVVIAASILFIWSLTLWYILDRKSPVRAPWTAREAAAAAVALGGGLLRAWAMRTLAQFFTFQVAIREDHKLVETGPYRWLIHPSYTGIVAGLFGLLWLMQGPGDWLGVTYRTPGVWAVVAPAVGCVLAVRVRDEEAAMAGHFGAAWDRYSAARWRLVPFMW